MHKSCVAVLLAAVSLAGCTGLRLVDSQVSSYTLSPFVAVGASYRFERLPSQQANAAQQAALEALATPALAKAGLQRNDAAANYSVQLSAGVRQNLRSPWDQPWPGYGLGWNPSQLLRGGHRFPYSSHFLLPSPGLSETPYYWRHVGIIMRHIASAQLVYESQASHDGPWPDSDAVLAAMFEAALRDFPQPPSGLRQVNIEIPR